MTRSPGTTSRNERISSRFSSLDAPELKTTTSAGSGSQFCPGVRRPRHGPHVVPSPFDDPLDEPGELDVCFDEENVGHRSILTCRRLRGRKGPGCVRSFTAAGSVELVLLASPDTARLRRPLKTGVRISPRNTHVTSPQCRRHLPVAPSSHAAGSACPRVVIDEEGRHAGT